MQPSNWACEVLHYHKIKCRLVNFNCSPASLSSSLMTFLPSQPRNSNRTLPCPRTVFVLPRLEGAARYAGFISSSCGGLRPLAKVSVALWAKKVLFMIFWLTLGHFWCSLLTLVTFTSKISNFEKKSTKIHKNSNKYKNNTKNPKI